MTLFVLNLVETSKMGRAPQQSKIKFHQAGKQEKCKVTMNYGLELDFLFQPEAISEHKQEWGRGLDHLARSLVLELLCVCD